MAVGVTLFARFAAPVLCHPRQGRDDSHRITRFLSIAQVSFASVDSRGNQHPPPGLFVARRTQQTQLPTYLKTGNFISSLPICPECAFFFSKSDWNVECFKWIGGKKRVGGIFFLLRNNQVGVQQMSADCVTEHRNAEWIISVELLYYILYTSGRDLIKYPLTLFFSSFHPIDLK